MAYDITNKAALVVVDAQVDFFEGGALAVPGSNAIISVVQKYVDFFQGKHVPIFFTRDWHPSNHISFRAQKGPWPPHCVQNTPGAKFHPRIKIPDSAVIISKAYLQNKDAYSGFEGTVLDEELKKQGILQISVCGLATDYCVKHTVLDALKLSYEVLLLSDAIKGVNLKPTDSDKALQEMEKSGAKKVMFGDLR